MLPSGDDLRIVYWTGASFVEVDRDTINMNTSSTQVWFKTQTTIEANGSDNNYYLYYGNSDAGSPPAYWSDSMGNDTASKVYLAADDFQEHNLGDSPDGWDPVDGYFKVGSSGSNRFMNSTANGQYVFAGDSSWTDYVVKVKMRDAGSASVNHLGISVRVTNVSNLVYFGWRNTTCLSLWKRIGGSYTLLGDWVVPEVGSAWHTHEIRVKGQNLSVYHDGTYYGSASLGAGELTSGNVGIFSSYGTYGHWDDYIVREYVSPEPSTALGSEERNELDYVDNNTSNMDNSSPTDKGTHSNFTSQKYHDAIYDTLTEEWVWYTLFTDSFDRSDNATVGNGWIEAESGTGNAKISGNRLVFDTVDELNVPIVTHTFSPHTSGLLNWTFVFNFNRSGAEGTYEFWMQLGNNATFVDPATSDNTGVAVNLKWAGTNRGMTNHEGFGYVQGASVTEVAIVSDNNAIIEVIADLDSNVFNLTIDGNLEASNVAFDNNVTIDAVRLYTDELNQNNFNLREFDDLVIQKKGNTTNYELDLEVQWTNVDYNEPNAELCIYCGTTASENITVSAWNGTAWNNVFTGLSSGWNNASVSTYLTSSNFTIRFTGSNETNDTTQESWNIDATILHTWTSIETTYDYVLRVNNTVTDSWEIRLKKYSNSSIDRLQNCTIYFHNSTDGTSSQISIEVGDFVNETGAWYDLDGLETIYIAMTVEANNAGTTYVYTYLEIRNPSTTTYLQYVITFEIT
jgi:hypothetical protein